MTERKSPLCATSALLALSLTMSLVLAPDKKAMEAMRKAAAEAEKQAARDAEAAAATHDTSGDDS